MKRSLLTLAITASLMAVGSAHAQGLSYLGQQIVPTGTPFSGTTVGGFSAIDYDAANARYFAISDDRSGINPARYYTLSLDLTQFQRSATAGSAGVSFNSVTTIQTPEGAAFATNTVDPEGLRYDAARGKLYWSNEGQRSGAGLQNPTVREMNLDGSHVRDFSVPARYNPVGSSGGTAAGDSGIRNNLAFENLAISPDGRTLWTATENALVQDGPAAGVTNGSPTRFLSFDIESGSAGAEYVYNVAPVVLPPAVAGQFATNGLTDFLALNDHQFITIERSFAIGAATPGVSPQGAATGNSIRLFLADTTGATDVSGVDSLTTFDFVPVSKTLLLDLSTLRNDDGSTLALDNIEGITFGPQLGGLPTVILVSDNNFGGTQFTQFIALSVTSPIPEPQTYALLLAGLIGIGCVVRRRLPTR